MGSNATPAAPPSPAEAQPAKKRPLTLREKAAAGAVAVAVVVGLTLYFGTRGPKDDVGRFQGEWRLAVPADAADKDKMPTARLTPVTVRVTGDKWVYLVGDKEQRRYAMTLRPEAGPKEIDLTQLAADDKPLIQKFPPPARPVVLRGIYSIDGDRAKVVVAPGDEPRPTSLDGEGWLLERVK